MGDGTQETREHSEKHLRISSYFSATAKNAEVSYIIDLENLVSRRKKNQRKSRRGGRCNLFLNWKALQVCWQFSS
jgi:hypothetical protein